MHLEVLVEEPSAKVALDLLLPKILGVEHSFAVHDFQCKNELQQQVPNRLRAYAARFGNDETTADWRVVILLDQDGADCRELKKSLWKHVRQARLNDRVLIRVVIEELEAWYFGDVEALRAAYPRVPATLSRQARYRNPDAIRGGTWEALDHLLKKSGYRSGLQKITTASLVASGMDPGRNRSHSFQAFRQGILKLVQT